MAWIVLSVLLPMYVELFFPFGFTHFLWSCLPPSQLTQRKVSSVLSVTVGQTRKRHRRSFRQWRSAWRRAHHPRQSCWVPRSCCVGVETGAWRTAWGWTPVPWRPCRPSSSATPPPPPTALSPSAQTVRMRATAMACRPITTTITTIIIALTAPIAPEGELVCLHVGLCPPSNLQCRRTDRACAFWSSLFYFDKTCLCRPWNVEKVVS